MLPFSLRSLLLAAIVLSNCISWTASRHHYTHNVSGHRSRHRRQGAGLFLSASYVLPGGEGAGWGDWGEVSPCSRTCGGGVASQKRICLQIGPDGVPQCTGGDTKYFSCQTQDCPAGSQDFREQQCSEFDAVTFRDVNYRWVPYKQAPNPCELNCMPHGERFYYRHRTKVVDGTRCNDESFDVCVNGVCQPVGCDMMLGSRAQEDKCRECRGSGASCETTVSAIDKKELTKGYNDLLIIPEGATNIIIAEQAPSTNYLALRSTNNTYYLNGDYQIGFPQSLTIAGTLWHYERSQQGFAAPDKLRCLGPTNEQLILALLLKDENVGIMYEFSVPKERAPPKNKQYSWVQKEFTTCSAPCGGGHQTGNVTCRSREELELVDDALCDKGLKPPTSQPCNTEACAAQWTPGSWSECSKRCGKGGTRSRVVDCTQIISNGYTSIVGDKTCFDILGPKPELHQTCNEDAVCPIWFTGPWKPCDKLCGEGKQTRKVTCYQKNGSRKEILSDKECEEEKPPTEQSCMIQPCDGVDWMLSPWSGCDTCLSTVRTRLALCATKAEEVVDDKFCAYHKTPVLQEPCDETKLPACDVQWYATQWSKCSTDCGKGVQTRKVFCGLFNGTAVLKVDDSRCAGLPKYNDTKECEVPLDECPPKLFASPWTACSSKCGDGNKTRQVMCLRGGQPTKTEDCKEEVLVRSQPCNTGPCDKDGLPVNRSPSSLDDDYEDCEEEEDLYPEVGVDLVTMMSDSTSDGLSSSPYTTAEHESTFKDIDPSDELLKASTRHSSEMDSDFSGSGDDDIFTTPFGHVDDLDLGSGDGGTSTTDGTGATGSTTSDTETTETKSTETTESTETESLTTGDGEKTNSTKANLKKLQQISISEEEIDSEESYFDSSEDIDDEDDDSYNYYPDSSESDETSETITSGSTEPLVSKVTSDMETTASKGSTPTSEADTTDSSSTSVTEDTSKSVTAAETEKSESTNTTDTSKPSSAGTTTTDTTESKETIEPITTNSTETTETATTESTNTAETVTTGSTNTTETGTPESTNTAETVTTGSTNTTETGTTESTNTAESVTTGSTNTTETGTTESTNTAESVTTGSTNTTETGTPESTNTTETVTTGSTNTTETTNTAKTGTTESSKTTDTSTTNTSESTETSTTNSTQTTESDTTESTNTTETETTETSTTNTSGSTQTSTTDSTQTTESDITESTNTTETETTETSTTNASESTQTSTTDSTETTGTGTTESTNTAKTGTTESTNTTESSETSETSTTDSSESTQTSTTDSTKTTGTGTTESTNTTETSTTESTKTVESSTTGSTETTETGTTGSNETTETDTTESTKTSTNEPSETTETGTTESTKTSETGSTESTKTTETATTESTKTTETGTTDSTETTETSFTVSTETTETGSTESTETTETGTTDSSETTETGTTDSTKTTETGTTESTETTETGTTDSTETTETGTTESTETTETGTTDSTETTETGTTESTETTETGTTESTETTETGTTESTESTETGTTESTETSETGTTESTETTETGTTESTESTETGATESTETTETGTTESTDSTLVEETESSSESTTEGSSRTTPWDLASTVGAGTRTKKARVCKPRSCQHSEFGCCPDKKTPARGPFDDGCPKPKSACANSLYDCCPDGVSPAKGPLHEGCPEEPCAETLFGCCESDNRTAAEGNDQEGCPPPPPACLASEFGCCKDETEAKGPEKAGCPETPTTVPSTVTEEGTKPIEGPTIYDSATTISPPETVEGCVESEYGCCFDNETAASGPGQEGCPCDISQFGCCHDGVASAQGPDFEGCVKSCNTSTFGCCRYSESPAHGPDNEGCCLLYPYGCCPDNYKPAEGPDHQGCGCQYTPYGCCPDNTTIATGSNKKGCGCQYSEHGCCPDRHTEATGPDYAGCMCHTYQFGCCPDGVTIAEGFHDQGCDCQHSTFGCCGDEVTHAKGPGHQGCDCSTSKHGCCMDGVTDATGPKFEGCSDKPLDRQAACKLKFERGPCRNYSVGWFYDTEYGGCSRFWYGGCEGNGNRFSSKEDCEDTCVSPPPKEACRLPQIKGACLGYNERWYYDTEREMCSNFVYGGCLGNANNFESRELCQAQCEPERSPDQCSLTTERGSCAGNYLRWGYNKEKRQCEQFMWGGCEGNNNRFSTEAACMLRCSPPGKPRPECSEAQDVGNCTDIEARWSFDQTENRCVPFYYSGCGGNGNKYTSRMECEEACPAAFEPELCTLPAVTGDCNDYREKWYYNTKAKRCGLFYYGGCGGNENRFDTEQECINRCDSPAPTPAPALPATPAAHVDPGTEFCFLAIDAGPCNNRLETKWGYDYTRGKCVSFQYGGCGGNQNNFPTEEYCARYCKPTQDICQLPMLSGPCEESVMSWFYDAASDSCSQFTYGGCEGNDNRFQTREQCETRCKSSPAPTLSTTIATIKVEDSLPSKCAISPDLEQCSEETVGEMWYYDRENSECKPHQNFNTGVECRTTGVFYSQEDCERSCGVFRNIDVCRYEKDPGPCHDFRSKYYYNNKTSRCEEFAYGGCFGGANRFSTEQECAQVCMNTIDRCTLPAETGNCRARLVKWYYHQEANQCYQFVFGGCGGNDNKFDSREECEGECRKQAPPPVVTTTTLAPVQTTVQPQPEPVEECRTPKSLEPCGSGEAAFYYDEATRMCKAANIGGCGSSINLYRSEEECERRCGAFRGIDVCRAVLDPGPCRAAFPKIYFDSASGSCREFTYGGCQGGPNRFSTIEECQEVCESAGPEGPEACSRYAEECTALESSCEYGLKTDLTPEGCNRCECEAPVNCDEQRRECETLRCRFGVDRTTASNGCEECKCVEDPCSRSPCSTAERCVVVPSRDPDTQEPVYSARCEVPQPPEADPDTEHHQPQVEAQEGGMATLRCYFHGNPPPKITWRFGELTIDDNAGRYRLSSDGALEIISVLRSDSGVYVCVAENEYGTAQQQVTLTIADVPRAPEADPDTEHHRPQVEATEGGKATLRCYFQGNPPPKITWRFGEVTIDDNVGRYLLSSDGALEIVSVVRSDSGVYVCVAENEYGTAQQQVTLNIEVSNDVIDCAAYAAECSRLWCPYGVQRTHVGGCERCSCVREETDCSLLRQECERLSCHYGVNRTTGDDGCERCMCRKPPCQDKRCPEGERCIATPFRDPITEETRYTANCQTMNKPGVCPSARDPIARSTESACRTECDDDANCRGLLKCCAVGCSRLCLAPAPPTTPPPSTTHSPDSLRAPQADPDTENHQPQVEAQEGSKATLRCYFHGNPPPKITWRFGEVTIVDDTGRYRLLADGALEIISLFRNDSGVYICLAHNEYGSAQQQVTLTVADGVPTPAAIEGAEGPVTGELGRPLVVRCQAYGYPVPTIYWYRGSGIEMVPYSNALYEARGQELRIHRLTMETLGDYVCQAYNGVGKAATWPVVVQAYLPPGQPRWSPYLVGREVLVTPRTPAPTMPTPLTTTEKPIIVIQPYFAPVHTSLPAASSVSAGAQLSLPCEVDGYPDPEVRWTKDDAPVATSDRIWIAGSRLTIERAEVSDSGAYSCHAANAYSSHSSTVRVTVQGNSPVTYPAPAGSRLTIERAEASDSGAYSCHAANAYSSHSSTVRVTVQGNSPVTYPAPAGSRLTIERAEVSDSGAYSCHATNAYSSHSSTVRVTVQEISIPDSCVDNPTFAKCSLIVKSRFCVHKYYSKFCCKSCVEAGQLDPRDALMQADQSFFRKK